MLQRNMQRLLLSLHDVCTATGQMLHAEGSLTRAAPERVSLLRFSTAGGLLACQSAGKVVELFR